VTVTILMSTSNTAVLLQWCWYAQECGGICSVRVGAQEVLVGTREWPACGSWEDARLSEETIGLRRRAKMAVISVAETQQL